MREGLEMQSCDIVRKTEINKTSRVIQTAGMFDIDLESITHSEEKWKIDLDIPNEWNIGVIIGPSGAGKSTLLREIFSFQKQENIEWSNNKSILDDIGKEQSISDVVNSLCSVGFSSPPSWFRPYHVLSNGEQFRVYLAKRIIESRQDELVVIDEFTSVVDRTVAKIASCSFAKAIRKKQKKAILATCHYDVLEWLEPDWVYEPHLNKMHRGSLWRRPSIQLNIERVNKEAWRMFKKHHYLSGDIHRSSECYCAFWGNVPVAFVAVLHFPHPTSKKIKREHRCVCLPDFQGIGIGTKISDEIAAIYTERGYRYLSVSSHPAMIAHRSHSLNWKLVTKPNALTKAIEKGTKRGIKKGNGYITGRLRATFVYIGKQENMLTKFSVIQDQK